MRGYVGGVSVPPRLPPSFLRADLESAGFTGWRSWQQLRQSELQEVPTAPAAYVVYRAASEAPHFIERSAGGHFKGKDPSVPMASLMREWVSGCSVVYIGKADQARRRLTQFARFGAGEQVGHWGGRYIWQIEDSTTLLVAWHPVSWPESAREYEKRLLAHFSSLHGGARPFANLTG